MHKRALGAAAVTGVAALALSACGGSSPTTPSNTGAAGTEQGGDHDRRARDAERHRCSRP